MNAKRLSRKDLLLIVAGLGVWILLGYGTAWLAHALTTPRNGCNSPCKSKESPARGPKTARRSLGNLAGKCRCE